MRRGLAVLIGLLLAACSPSPQADSSTITVFAAASLTESFGRVGKDYEAAHPGPKVVFNFGGSATLAAQINQGAPADVFAAASPATIKTVSDAGGAEGQPVIFARNQLVIAVPKGNPRKITSLADLASPGIKLALCAEQVPCGAAAKLAAQAAGVTLKPVTLEQDVKAALAKVRLGEADAALVYRTDVRAIPAGVEGIEFPESAVAINDYVIVVTKSSRDKRSAQSFMDYVLSDRGRAVLTEAGFQEP